MLVCGRHNKWLANTLQQPYSEWIPTSVFKRQCTMDQSSFLFNSFQETTSMAFDLLSQHAAQIKNKECFQLQTPASPTPPVLRREVSRGSVSTAEIISGPPSASTPPCSQDSLSSHSSDYESKKVNVSFNDSVRDACFESVLDEQRVSDLRTAEHSDDEDNENLFNKQFEEKQQALYRECQVLEFQSLFHSDSKALGGWINYTFDPERHTFKDRTTGKDLLFHAFAANVVQYTDGLADVMFHNLLTQQNILFCDEVAVMHSLMINRNLHRIVNKPFLSARKCNYNNFICTVTMKVFPKTLKNEITYNVPVYFWAKLSKSNSRMLDWNLSLHYPPASL